MPGIGSEHIMREERYASFFRMQFICKIHPNKEERRAYINKHKIPNAFVPAILLPLTVLLLLLLWLIAKDGSILLVGENCTG